MSPLQIILLIAAYFGVLLLISHLTSKKEDNEEFFTAGKTAPWYVVAFGMIGVSLSGVTYLSVPGAVGADSFSYLQQVLGNVVGYWLIMAILLPLYYKMNLTSIYAYLGERFGGKTQKTGSFFFLISRIMGASFRLYLVALVLQKIIFDAYNIPFYVTVGVTIFLVWIYTQKGGLKTIIWTDTLQTTFMLLGLLAFLFWLSGQLGGFSEALAILKEKNLTQVFFYDPTDTRYFVKGLFAGVFITLVMNGLDQDMMQKNLACKSLKDARKNMFVLSIVFLVVNILFLFLGGLLSVYAQQKGIDVAKGDYLFTVVAQQAPQVLFVLFVLGVIAAAYSSADSALTSLTTAFCLDFLDMTKMNGEEKIKTRKKIHVLFSVFLFSTIMIFASFNDDSIFVRLFTMAGFTYGPLLGMYAFGLFTKVKVKDSLIPWIAVLCPVLSWILKKNVSSIGFEILIYNGALTFVLMLVASFMYKEKAVN